ncbi:MAG: hypothetical protein Q8O98_00165 [bacterium]|nr:hypothetical protein [bacterium]
MNTDGSSFAVYSQNVHFIGELTMVTTNSLNTDLHFTADELYGSELTEDRDLADEAKRAIDHILEKLKPVLVYVDENMGGIKGVLVAKKENGSNLLLSRDGKWFHLNEGQGSPSNEATLWQDGWSYFKFSDLIGGLKSIFADAQLKKEQHLTAIAERKNLLSKIDELIHGEPA